MHLYIVVFLLIFSNFSITYSQDITIQQNNGQYEVRDDQNRVIGRTNNIEKGDDGCFLASSQCENFE